MSGPEWHQEAGQILGALEFRGEDGNADWTRWQRPTEKFAVETPWDSRSARSLHLYDCLGLPDITVDLGYSVVSEVHAKTSADAVRHVVRALVIAAREGTPVGPGMLVEIDGADPVRLNTIPGFDARELLQCEQPGASEAVVKRYSAMEGEPWAIVHVLRPIRDGYWRGISITQGLRALGSPHEVAVSIESDVGEIPDETIRSITATIGQVWLAFRDEPSQIKPDVVLTTVAGTLLLSSDPMPGVVFVTKG